MAETGVVIYGARETINALREFDKEAVAEIRKGLRKAVEPIRARGQSLVPGVALRNWSRYGWPGRDWSQGSVKSGIAVSFAAKRARGSSQTAFVAIVNRNAAGAIYELAGRNSDNRLSKGLINSGHGGASRLIWRAFDEMNGSAKVEEGVKAVMQEAERKLQSILDRVGGVV